MTMSPATTTIRPGPKTILEEEGASDLEFTVLCIQGYPDGERASTIWQAGLAEAGVKLNIEVQELSVWLDNYLNHTYDVIWNVFPGFADPNYFVSLGSAAALHGRLDQRGSQDSGNAARTRRSIRRRARSNTRSCRSSSCRICRSW